MDVVPRGLEGILASGQEGTDFDWSISEQVAEEAAGRDGNRAAGLRARGHAALRRLVLLHPTAAEPSMRNSRMAIESWFFGASAAPEQYSPLAA